MDAFDSALERSYPFIKWREPITMSLLGDGSVRYACRFCIARHGLRGWEIPGLPRNRHEIVLHIQQEHADD
jgi:hypothetical protein